MSPSDFDFLAAILTMYLARDRQLTPVARTLLELIAGFWVLLMVWHLLATPDLLRVVCVGGRP